MSETVVSGALQLSSSAAVDLGATSKHAPLLLQLRYSAFVNLQRAASSTSTFISSLAGLFDAIPNSIECSLVHQVVFNFPLRVSFAVEHLPILTLSLSSFLVVPAMPTF